METSCISTSNDKFTPAKDIYLSRTRYYEKKDNETKYQVYTDRALYRPGQTVHVTAIDFVNMKDVDAKVPVGRDELDFQLCNASWKEVEMKKAKVDEYGTASVDLGTGRRDRRHVSCIRE